LLNYVTITNNNYKSAEATRVWCVLTDINTKTLSNHLLSINSCIDV